MTEIERIENVGCEAYQTTCRKCGKEIWLYFNGGELDAEVCCGLRYILDTPQIDFVVLTLDLGEDRSEK